METGSMALRHTVGTVMALWLLSIIICLAAVRLTFLSTQRRFWPAAILSAVAFVGGFLGMTHFRVMASRTINGRIQWNFDSRWFFVATMVLAGLTLALALWKQLRSRRPSAPS